MNQKRKKMTIEKLKWPFLLEVRLLKPLGLQIDFMKPDQVTRKENVF
jgi:hypothetical protein